MDQVTEALKTAASYTDDLMRDDELRSSLRSAVDHGKKATRRMEKDTDVSGLVVRIADDKKLRKSLRALIDDLDHASDRIRRKRTHRVRNALLLVGGSGIAVAMLPDARRWITRHMPGTGSEAESLANVV
jgi:hypothetical protein